MMRRTARSRARQRGEITFGNIVFMAAAAAVCWWGYYFGPHYYVRYRMNKVVIQALYDWRDKGDPNRPMVSLEEQMKAKKFPSYMSPEVCTTRENGLFRHMECEWQVLVKAPIKKETILKFKVYKYLNAEGLLEDVQ